MPPGNGGTFEQCTLPNHGGSTFPLLGTIRAVCGKELPDSKIDSVFKSLIKLSYVKVQGTKVQFNGL